MALVQYLMILETIVSYLTPVTVGFLALRRMALSRSFNQLIYAFMVVLCSQITLGLLNGPALIPVLKTAAPIYALFCLALWVLIITFGASTRGLQAYDR